jgi:hypothetical protein
LIIQRAWGNNSPIQEKQPHPGCNLAKEVSWIDLVQLWLSKAPYETEISYNTRAEYEYLMILSPFY